jgi:hypothetical protein
MINLALVLSDQDYNQGKMAEVEAMYVRALQGYENAGVDHPRTRATARNLDTLRTSSLVR